MGTQNNFCVLTGLELPEGSIAYMALMNPVPVEYVGHYIDVPPLRGKVTGYGNVELLEDVPCLGLKLGDHWPAPSDDDAGPRNVFIHAAIFDAVADAPITFKQDETIGLQADAYCQQIRDKIADRSRSQKIADALHLKPAKTICNAFALMPVFRHYEAYWFSAYDTFASCIDNPEHLENAFELARRGRMLKSAEAELRRPLVPVNWGPQECDSRALHHISQLTTLIARKACEQDT